MAPLPVGLTITSPSPDATSAVAVVQRLFVVFAPEVPDRSVVALSGAPVTLGRDHGVELRLPDAQVSRAHARVECDPATGGPCVRDLGSRNGIYVDGARVTSAPLRHGSVIRAGASLVLYVEHAVRRDATLRPERPGLRGPSVAMQRVRGDIELVARHRTTVLVTGETGVGKERVAEEIHAQSGRTGRCVVVNCAAIPEHLAESELFGHVPGAFTGATGRSEGLFAAADGGTLFLDEVGELSATLQAKLLRALATGEVRPVGGTHASTVDVRLVAATHRPLRAAVDAGAFRGDLYARLAAWEIHVPPLRDRREDILPLARSFAANGVTLSADAAEALLLHDWPFNVRELRHAVDAASLRARGGVIGADQLPEGLAVRAPQSAAAGAAAPVPPALLVDLGATPSRDDLLAVLTHFDGSVQETAGFFGRDRKQVYRWIERHGVSLDSIRRSGS